MNSPNFILHFIFHYLLFLLNFERFQSDITVVIRHLNFVILVILVLRQVSKENAAKDTMRLYLYSFIDVELEYSVVTVQASPRHLKIFTFAGTLRFRHKWLCTALGELQAQCWTSVTGSLIVFLSTKVGIFSLPTRPGLFAA